MEKKVFKCDTPTLHSLRCCIIRTTTWVCNLICLPIFNVQYHHITAM